MSSLVAHVRRGSAPAREAVEAGLAAARHRGGLSQVVVCGTTVLGVTKHDDGDRAFVGAVDGHAVAIAGSIDNLAELIARIRESGSPVVDEAPPAVVLAAFRAFRADLPRHLRGVYAIAISDGRSITAFRDHLGGGTLFYRQSGADTWFGSEAKQVLAAAGIPREPDTNALEALFYGHREDDLPPAVRGVTRLAKASRAVATGDAVSISRYWDPTALVETSRLAPDELRPEFDRLMGRAADRVLRGDDILALSGGIDSPAIAAYAADAYAQRFGGRLPAISMVFPDYPSADERPLIAEVVERFNLEWHTYQPPTAAQTLGSLDEWTSLTDGPWMGWWEPGMDEDRYERIGALGRRNYVTGDFAEFAAAMSFHVVPHLIWKGRLRAAAAYMVDQRRHGIRIRNLARQLVSAVLPGAFFVWYRGVRPLWPVPAWVDPSRVVHTNMAERLQPWQRWRHFQLAGFIGVGLPFEAYQIFNESRRVSVRWPWADVDLWEFFISLPAELKFPGAQQKALVRRLIRGRVPDSIVDRREHTVFDEFVQKSFDYASLLRWTGTGDYRLPGVDYAVLRRRLEEGNLRNDEYAAAKDVAQVHAFLANWTGARPSDVRGPSGVRAR